MALVESSHDNNQFFDELLRKNLSKCLNYLIDLIAVQFHIPLEFHEALKRFLNYSTFAYLHYYKTFLYYTFILIVFVFFGYRSPMCIISYSDWILLLKDIVVSIFNLIFLLIVTLIALTSKITLMFINFLLDCIKIFILNSIFYSKYYLNFFFLFFTSIHYSFYYSLIFKYSYNLFIKYNINSFSLIHFNFSKFFYKAFNLMSCNSSFFNWLKLIYKHKNLFFELFIKNGKDYIIKDEKSNDIQNNRSISIEKREKKW